MKRSAAIFLSLTLMLVSLAALVASGWLWHRSRSVSDLYYRYEPTAGGGSAMRGGASMKGALVFGSIVDASRSCEVSGYRHDVWPVRVAWKFYRGKKPFFVRRDAGVPVMGLVAGGAV